MLRLFETRRVLRLLSAGPLLPWIGPALRGLVAGSLKIATCRYPPLIQRTERRHCKGCPLMAGCPVGETFEADPVDPLPGQEDGVRPISLVPHFPLPTQAEPGLLVSVRAVFVGERAASHADALWNAAANGPGLGWAGVRFAIEPSLEPDSWREVSLPAALHLLPTVPEVRVELRSPLFLKREIPSFGDLLRASLRVLGGLLRQERAGGGIDFKGLKDAAEGVPLLRHWYEPFAQGHRSSRSGERLLEGTVGAGDYGPVPGALARWIVAAGRVGVGGERVAGGGSWRVWWRGAGGEWLIVE